MKDTLLTLTKKWIETKSVPAFDFSSRSISSYDTGNVVLLGMRRLGKTEYLKYRYQTFFNLAENISDEVATQGEDQGTPTSSETQHIDKVLFIDFDSPQFSNVIFEQKTSEEFLKLTNAIIDLINEKDIKLVLIDEIQARVEWSKWLKGMVDQHPDVTFIATGSDAVKLKQSGELGGTRFKTIYVGPLTYKEYLSSHRFEKFGSDVVDYLDNIVYPTDDIDNDIKNLYAMVVEKQLGQTNIHSSNIANVFRSIALNPGQDVNPNAISKTTRENSDAKVYNKQVDQILEFLVDSKLIIQIENTYTSLRASKRNEYKYYPASWNAYKFFATEQSIWELNESTIPKSGFVFENVIISNVVSSLHEQIDIHKVGYYDDKSGKECDLVYGDLYIEIKSMDLSKEKNSSLLKAVIKKMKKFDSPVIVHTGETFEMDSIKIYSYEEFLGGEIWIQEKK